MNLEVHLVERLLHVQHMLCRHLDQTAAVSPERANSTNEARRTEAGSQQTHRMEVLKPLAVGHVGLPAGNILYVSRGLEVCLVNAQHVKNVPGRKTDVSDCQWLQYLHSVGLLRASFRPPGFICAIRSLWRHRGSLIQMAAEHVLHMQKALDQMSLQVHRVLIDITGLSGLRILDAILAGERNPVTLARLCRSRVKSSRDTVAKSLEGDYRAEHVFALRQSLAGYRYYQGLIAEVDEEIQRHLADLKTIANLDLKP